MVTLEGLLKQLDGYIVGGAVRDQCLDLTPKDIDICTPQLTDDIIARTPQALLYPVGEKFGTIGMKTTDVGHVEVTTMRRDITPGRHPVVEWTTDLTEDLSRRDFTVNAMAMKYDGVIIDPFNGLDDINAKILRAVGDAEARLTEDPLRALRAIRFIVKYGFTPEKSLIDALCMVDIRDISGERIRDELDQILMHDPVMGWKWLRFTGMLEQINPKFAMYHRFMQNPMYHDEGDLDQHTLTGIKYGRAHCFPVLSIKAFLVHDIGKIKAWDGRHYHGHAAMGVEDAEIFMRKFKHSSMEIEAVKFAVKYHMILHDWDKLRTSKKVMLCQSPYLDTLLDVQEMDSVSRPTRISMRTTVMYFKATIKEKVNCYLNGHDLIEGFNLKPGLIFSQIFADICELQVEDEIENDAQARAWLHKNLWRYEYVN